jgi:hypothetical protein
VPVDAPVAGEAGGDALRARAVRAAVEEGEVRGDEIRPVGHPDRQLGREVMLTRWNRRQQIRPRRRAIHSVCFPRGARPSFTYYYTYDHIRFQREILT